MSNEHAETGSSIKVLELHNYHQWSDLMLSYFLKHNLDGIVDGMEVEPDSLAERNNWLLRQKKAAGFIARKLDSSNRDMFINEQTRRKPLLLFGWPSNLSTHPRKQGTNPGSSLVFFHSTATMEILRNTQLHVEK